MRRQMIGFLFILIGSNAFSQTSLNEKLPKVLNALTASGEVLIFSQGNSNYQFLRDSIVEKVRINLLDSVSPICRGYIFQTLIESKSKALPNAIFTHLNDTMEVFWRAGCVSSPFPLILSVIRSCLLLEEEDETYLSLAQEVQLLEIKEEMQSAYFKKFEKFRK